ncbi:helix-turn-helix domain-containing protein [Clostridium pasteurianum]|uniref:Putative transcriptional regulator with cupin domain n=1 Tax=Clostridium pasteurianum BC1 TaxID=86416 RepID=R4JY66_CLOPA|nr:XRE family transcriptional regulator [Clostridium pasteurianum]AGK95757.1 putative transcriptional regulator with cupin domain [Clostridium pasteurianum BC1]
MNLNSIISSNLKRLRGERKLSLSKLSELSGVSKVMLGQIERGESNPTINTIWKISKGLKIPYTNLIDEHISNAILVKKQDTSEQLSENGNYRVYNYFSTNNKRNFELFTAALDVNSSYYSEGHGEKSEEYILISKGELILDTEDKKYILDKGDSIQFDSSKPHRYINNSDSIVEMVIINHYYL